MRVFAATGALVLAACGFHARLGGDVDAPPMVDDAGREIRTWSFDSAADFAAVGHEARAMTIDPRGALTPDGYAYGGLVARGVGGVALWSATDADWAKLATVTPAATGLWGGDALTAAADLRFAGVGANPTMLTMWFEGELFLDAAATQLRAAGNATAFVYVARDGVTFEKLAHDETASVTVPAPGWYPVRVGWAAIDGGGDLELALDVGDGLAPVPRTRLRAPTSALQGTLRTVYYRQLHGGGIGGRPPVMHVQETALHAATTFDPPLPGSVTTAVVPYDWSARWTGQLYATTPGTYTFRVQSSDGNRLLAGTASGATRYARNDNGNATTTVDADLAAGWNDLVLDYNDVGGNMALNLAITAAPEAALVGAAVPRERLRPVEPRGDRLITGAAVPAAPIDVPDNANTYRFLEARIDAHPSEQATRVEVTAVLRTTRPGDLGYRLIAPDGTTITDPPLIKNADGGQHIVHYAGMHGAGKPAAGRWRFGVVDANGGGNVTTYEELTITVHTSGGPEQIATTARWRSPIVANATTISQIDTLAWDARAPAGATVEVRIRTCDDAACDGDAWSEPLVSGTPPVVPVQRYIQLEVTMTSDGTHEPELRSLMVQYRTDPT